MKDGAVVAVDLTPLRGDGSNGGARHVILGFLDYIQQKRASEFQFVYLCNSSTQHEIRNFCRDTDKTVCILKLDDIEPLPSHLLTKNDSNFFDGQNCFEVLRKHKVELIYAPFGNTQLEFPGVPTVIMIHDLLHRDFPHSLPQHEISHRESFFTKMLSVAERVQVNSEFTKGRLMEYYDLGDNRVFVTHLPVHSRLTQRTEFNKTTNAKRNPYFMYPSNFWVHKNHETLVVAYQKYIHEMGNKAWGLVFTGHEDDRKKYIRRLVTTLSLDKNVEFLDYVSDDELTTHWSNARALIFPSLHEGFGIPVVEAMHFHLPIIAHDGTSLREVAGDAAHFCDCRNPFQLAEAMIRISTDNKYRKKLREAGSHRLKSFELENEGKVLADNLQATINEGTDRLSHCGISIDGWIGKRCVLNTPKNLGRAVVEIACHPFPEERYISIRIGDNPFGSYDLVPGEENIIQFVAYFDGENICIETNIQTKISIEDPRYFGVRLKSVKINSNHPTPYFLWRTT